MDVVALANAYLCASVLLAVTAALAGVLRALRRRGRLTMSWWQTLSLIYLLAAASLLLPFAASIPQAVDVLPHTAQVWSAPDPAGEARTHASYAVLALPRLAAPVPLTVATRVASVLLLGGWLVWLARLAAEALLLRRLLAGAHPIVRRAGVYVLAAAQLAAPFSLWTPRRRYVLIPQTLLLQPALLRIALRHELQHHRQGDTWLLYVAELLRASFLWNPAVWILVRQVRELQELACDEAVLARGGVPADSYCRSLLAVAEGATFAAPHLLAGMTGGGRQALLARIASALEAPRRPARALLIAALSSACLLLLAGVALAAAQPIADRRITLAQARDLAAEVSRSGGIDVPLNDAVLRQLNLLLGTPEGRARVAAARERMAAYEPLIRARLEAEQLPTALLAVPLVESGYRNLPQSADERHGAGLWMFIAPTARRFGLTVDARRDERLDVAAETDAAARFIGNLHRQFGDWPLALLAYNAGTRRVEEGIDATGSSDAWELTRRGYENDADYLPRVLAAMLVLARAPTD